MKGEEGKEGGRQGSQRMKKIIDKSKRWKIKKGLRTSHIANEQPVLSRFVANPKPVILSVNSFASFYSQIYSKHVVCLASCQAVYFVQSEPKFTDKVTEAIFVVIPGAVEINRAIHSLLKDCPSPTRSSLITRYVKGTWTIWVDCVNTANPLTGFVQLSTVFSC